VPELDISAAADEVVRLLQQRQAQQAAVRFEALRSGQSLVVREALDRYVLARAPAELAALREDEANGPAVIRMLDRVRTASRPPRMPVDDETEYLSQAQQYDVYASVIAVRGEAAARDALLTQDRVILGLRKENRTTDMRGKGDFNDRMVVVWRDADGQRHARTFLDANTEPSAQYDGHAKTRPRSPGFGDVITRVKTEGDDVNEDGIRDLGRLAEGTTELLQTTHALGQNDPEFSLRPTPEAIAAGTRRVERDSNGDGWFDADDRNGVQQLNRTFKFHRGGDRNTYSAGCQTIRRDDYDGFVETIRGTPGQDRWQYVLTSVAPGQTREVVPRRPLAPEQDPRHARHPDHALQRQISARLQDMGAAYAEHADDYSLQLLLAAKANGFTAVDQIVASNAVGTRSAGETLFLVQGALDDPAALRLGVTAAIVTDTPVNISLQQLQQQADEGVLRASNQGAPAIHHPAPLPPRGH
jgi:hypothetical protein